MRIDDEFYLFIFRRTVRYVYIRMCGVWYVCVVYDDGDGNRCMKKVIQSILYAVNTFQTKWLCVFRHRCHFNCETECAHIEYVIQAADAIC